MIHYFHRCSAAVIALTLGAATALAYDIKGKIVDSDGEPMVAATVKLLAAKDSTFINGVKTNIDGNYSLTGVKSGNYIVEAMYIGYRTTHKDTKIGSKSVTLEPIVLEMSAIELQEVTVVGVASEIKVKEDTVEYNAGSYKTQPNAVVEDLLKRLPGVEVDSEGKITANGKEVKKILIEGKEFFADDPQVASKNLPVEMIEKLQVVDRKSDLARLTGVDDGEDETVINLTVKKGMQSGYFGAAEAGYGTEGHYLGQFNVNRFWNGNQMTLLGNFNDINQLGFTDSNGNRFRRFGGSQGLTTSQALGINFNVGNKEIFRVGGNVMYSHSDRNVIRRQERQYLEADSTSFASSGRNARDRGHNVSAGFRMEWMPDSFNTLEFRPTLSYNMNSSSSIDSTITRAGDAARTTVSRSLNTAAADGHSLEFGARLIYSHSFRRHRGRSFSISAEYNHSNIREHENTFSRNLFYLLNDSVDIYDQEASNHSWTDRMSARLTWTEPLGNVKNGRFLTFAYNLNYRWNNADNMIYDHPLLPMPGPDGFPEVDYSQLIFNPDLSNRFRNDYFNQDIRLGFRQVTKSINFEGGISLVPQMSKSIDLINSDRDIDSRWVVNVAPFLRYRHRFSKTRSLNIHYRGRSSQPSLTQLQPVPDMSDPMNIIYGNPALDPSFSHNMNIRFQDFNTERQRSIMLMANMSLTQNSIVSNITRDRETGAQTTRYENVNGVWSARVMSIFSQPLRNKFWQINNHLFVNYNRNVGFNNGQRNRSGSLMVAESFGIAFRPDNLELELRPNYRLQTTHNSLQGVGGQTVHTYGGTFSAYYSTPIGVILNSDLTYSGSAGYAAGYNQKQWMWNASISYQFLPSRSLTVALKAYDLLNQRSNISRTITANYIDDTMINDLTRYFMLTVSYKFNTFGKGNMPTDRNMRGPGGPGGPGGHGGRPPRF